MLVTAVTSIRLPPVKHDDFNLHVANFPFLSSNIPCSLWSFFFSWVIWYDMVCSSSECIVLGGCDFPISLLGKDMSGNVWYRLAGNFMVNMGIFSNNMYAPLPNVTWHVGEWPYVVSSDPPLIRDYTYLWLCYRTGSDYRFDFLLNC